MLFMGEHNPGQGDRGTTEADAIIDDQGPSFDLAGALMVAVAECKASHLSSDNPSN